MAYKVDLDALAALIEKATKIDQAIDERLTAIDNRIAALHVHWDSKAATAHKTAHDTWMTSAKEMQTALRELRDGLKGAHDNYFGNATSTTYMWP